MMRLIRSTTRLVLAATATLCATGAAFAQCPVPPTTINASPACDGNTIQWNGTAPGTTTISLYRSTTNDSATATLVTTAPGLSAGSITDSAAMSGMTTFYWLRAGTTAGPGCPSGMGPISGSVNATRPSAIGAAPINLTANNPTCSPVNLSWTPVPGADSYAVYSSTTPTLAGNAVPIGSSSGPSYAATVNSPGATTLYFFVAAANSCGTGPKAGPVTASLSGLPDAVTNLNAFEQPGCTTIRITWDLAARATQYTILATPSGGSPAVLVTLGTAATSHIHTPSGGVSAWTYQVIASNGCGQPAVNPSIAIDISQPATFSASPASLAVDARQNAVFSAGIHNALTVRWQRDGVNLSNSSRITGADTAKLTIISATPADAGLYTLSATGCIGSPTTSPAAVLGVRQKCQADADFSGIVTIDDIFVYLNLWFSGCP